MNFIIIVAIPFENGGKYVEVRRKKTDSFERASLINNPTDRVQGLSMVSCSVIDLAQVFKRAELALSAGGTTTWELIRCGVTPYILRVADNQDVVSEGLETYQIGADLGIYRADSPRDWAELLAPVEEALISSHRARDRQRAQTLIDGRGVWRLIDRLLTLASSI